LELAKSVIIILITGILSENFVLSKFLGICPFLGVSKKPSSSLGMGAAVTLVMMLSTALTYPVYHLILVPLGVEFMQTPSFILIIALFVQILEMFLKKYLPPIYNTMGMYLPLITTNCAVLGVTILNIDNEFNFFESLLNAFAGGAGFLVAMLLFAGVRVKLERCNVPKAFRGIPITLIAASLVSLAFVGFGGIADSMFSL
jgi:electron transport complex protein RnfA